MKLHKLTIFVCLIILIIGNIPVFGQSNFILKLSRRNPDNWFSLHIPKIMGKAERKADVDGGFYISDSLEIDYDYWTFENTPNWLRGRYATSLILACPRKSKNTYTLRTKIDGKRAIIQRCSETDERKGFRYIYYVTFPKVKVFNGEYFDYGMFNFTIEYKDKHYLQIVEQIVRSMNFEK
jgi:hypothetical protein